MSWLNKLFGTPSSSKRGDGDALWLYVQCDRCGTPLAVRVDRRNEVASDYESGGAVLRQEMMHGVCFQPTYAALHVDAQGHVTERSAATGNFLTRTADDAAALVRARGFDDAAGLAHTVLQDVARDAHRDWSGRLNRAAGELLDRFAGEHAEIRFSEQLDFVVRDPASAREWPRAEVERRLSAGARDQIYLAIRLALAEQFSSQADPLPLILDDPLVTSDDERFVAAMAYLAEQAARRQVIVLTCHTERHRWLLERHPELAERVQVLAIASSAPAAG